MVSGQTRTGSFRAAAMAPDPASFAATAASAATAT